MTEVLIVGGQDINYNSIVRRFIMRLYITNGSLGNKGINISKLVQEKLKSLDEIDLFNYVESLTESDYIDLFKEYGKAEDNIQVGLPEINYEVFKELNESYDYTPYTDTFGYLDTSKIRKQLKYEKNSMIRKQLQIDLRNSLPVTGRHSKGCKRKRK